MDLIPFVRNLRSSIYDAVIVRMTTHWYREVLLRLPPRTTILDVGIGTATSLIANRDLIVSKGLTIVGVDYDADYVKTAQASVAAYGLESHIQVVCCSIHDYQPPKSPSSNNQEEMRFDAIYFSGSFMILPEKAKALRRCVQWLTPHTGRVYFTQTFETKGFVGRMMPLVKKLLKFVLTIDFGDVTFEEDFRQVLGDADVKLLDLVYLVKGRFRSQVLIEAAPQS